MAGAGWPFRLRHPAKVKANRTSTRKEFAIRSCAPGRERDGSGALFNVVPCHWRTAPPGYFCRSPPGGLLFCPRRKSDARRLIESVCSSCNGIIQPRRVIYVTFRSTFVANVCQFASQWLDSGRLGSARRRRIDWRLPLRLHNLQTNDHLSGPLWDTRVVPAQWPGGNGSRNARCLSMSAHIPENLSLSKIKVLWRAPAAHGQPLGALRNAAEKMLAMQGLLRSWQPNIQPAFVSNPRSVQLRRCWQFRF